jgi:TolB-like protein
MASLIPGYEYDIFISYRQKDNKHDGWVTEFVNNLKGELESTFKEEISVYFDINPHDGLLETHDVDSSLKEKLKCLIFIPILSRTYCDPKSFAWEHEFKEFIDHAYRDQFGLKVKLPNSNVANRVLPVLIHDLDNEDIKLCESTLGGVLRGIEFIYKEPGVNKPLTLEDDEKKNLNSTKYRIQINKTANALKDIISGLKGEAVKTAPKPIEVLLTPDKPITQEKSILVLPFDNMSSDPDQEYFSDGLTEEIITDLSHINDLLVISRSSAMTFKGTKKTIPEIARSVNVRFVLEGSVRKSGKSLRITAQLIDAMNDAHLWAEKYSGTIDDIFDIQEKVSQKIVEALKGRLSPTDRQKLFTDPATKNVGVYEVYSRAHYEFWKYEPGSQERALSLLEDAVVVFGEHPLLLSGIGAIHWQFYHQRGDINQSHLERIKECAGKLFAIDPGSAPGHRLSSYTALHDGDSEKAIKHLYKSMRTEPGDTETLLWLSYLLTFHAGQPNMAQPIAENWIAIDPLHPVAEITLRLIEWMKGDFDNAIKGLEKCYRQEPDNPFYSFYMGHILTWKGRQEEAYYIAEKMHRLDPDEGMGQGLRFITSATTGRTEEAINAVTPSTKQWLWMDFHMPWLMAEGYSILGEKNEAIRWLDRAVEKGFFNYPMLNEKDPLLNNIRGEPGFKNLMNKIKYKWENFEV